jgi:hypothetical protein
VIILNVSLNCNIQENLNKDEIKININAGQNSEELQNIISKIQEISKQKDNIYSYYWHSNVNKEYKCKKIK